MKSVQSYSSRNARISVWISNHFEVVVICLVVERKIECTILLWSNEEIQKGSVPGIPALFAVTAARANGVMISAAKASHGMTAAALNAGAVSLLSAEL